MSGRGNPYEFHRGELTIREDREHYRIRAWPGPQAFTSEAGVEWKRCWPEFRFICHPAPPAPVPDDVPPPPPPKNRKPKKAKPSPQMELGLVSPEPVRAAVPPPSAPKLMKDEAFELLRQTLPEAVAEALAPFQSCQWNPLVFVHFNRGFLDLLKSSPALAYYLANDRDVSSQIYKEYKTFLPKLIGTKQTELLVPVGLGRTKQMVGIVKKIRAESADMGNIRALQNVRGNVEALKRLSHLKSINQGVIELVGAGDRLMKYWTPSFLDEVSRNEANHCAPAIYGLFSQCMRMHWERHPRREFPRMDSLARFHAYFDELAQEQPRLDEEHRVREIDGLRPFPPPPIPNSDNIQALISDEQLRQEGTEQHNCAGTYRGCVRVGQIYLYRVLKPERATLSIVKGAQQWHLNELQATYNRPVKPETIQSVKAWLNANQLGASG